MLRNVRLAADCGIVGETTGNFLLRVPLSRGLKLFHPCRHQNLVANLTFGQTSS